MFSRKQLMKLILPLVVEQLLAMTIGIVDTLMVATCGEAAVSGISLVDSINILLINIFSALATGGALAANHLYAVSVQGRSIYTAQGCTLMIAGSYTVR